MSCTITTSLSHSVEQTMRLAATLAERATSGDCIALHGQLGAGKTQFVRGLVRALGGDPRQVSSPTYVLLHIYDTPRGKVYHLDAYRVAGSDDFEGIGFEELLEQEGLVVVEWAERVADLLPRRHWSVRIESENETRRRIEISPPTDSPPRDEPYPKA